MRFHFYFTFLWFLNFLLVAAQNITLLARTSKSIVLLTLNTDNPASSISKTLVPSVLEDTTILLSSNNENLGFYLSQRVLSSVDINTGETKLIGTLGNHISDSPSTFDYDWITENFYIGVQGNRESGGRIEACSLKNISSCTVVLHEKLDYLYSLVTSPRIGKMFWQSGVSNKIEMSSMTGENYERKPFELNGSARYRSLTFHVYSKRLFFVKSMNNKHEIVACTIDLLRKCQTIAKVDDIVNLVVAKNHIVWSMSVRGILNYCQIDRCELTRKTTDFSEIENFVLIDNEETSDGKGLQCSVQNGGCSHFCLVGDRPRSQKCGCPIGISLENDQLTCNRKGVQQMMYIASLNGIFEISLDTFDYTAFPHHFEESSVIKTEDIDYKVSNEMIYWIEDERDENSRNSIRYLKRSDRRRSSIETILTLPKTVNRIRIDEINDNIYWLDNSQVPRLGVTSLSSLFSKTIIFGKVKNIKTFVVHFSDNLVIIARDADQNSVIEAFSLDGSKQFFVEVLKPKAYVVDMNIDRKRKLLFWIESISSDLVYFDIATSKTTRLKLGLSKQLPHPGRLEISGTDVFIYSSIGRSILKVSLKELNNPVTSLIETPIFGAKGIKVVSFEDRNYPVSSCHLSNGNCEHVCVLSRHGQQSCLCADGYFFDFTTQKCFYLDTFGVALGRDSSLFLIPTLQPSTSQLLLSDLPDFFKSISSFDVDMIKGEFVFVGQSSPGIGMIARVPVPKHSTVGKIDPILQTSVIIEEESLDGVFDVAVDYLSGNIFWTNSISNRVEVCDSTGEYRKVLAWSHIKPRFIALSIRSKVVIFYNEMEKVTIHKITMRGDFYDEDPIGADSKEVTALTFNQEKNHYYLVEEAKEWLIIDSAVDGSSRDLLYAGSQQPISVSPINGELYIIDVDGKLGLHESKVLKSESEKLGSMIKLRMFDRRKSLTPLEKSNFCHNNNGRCDQLCLYVSDTTTLVPHTSAAPYRDHCFCADHFVYDKPSTNDDSDQCSPSRNMIIAATHDRFFGLELAGVAGKTMTWRDSPLINYPIKRMKNRKITSISFHPTDRVVYWIEEEDRAVLKFVSLDQPKEILVISAAATSQCSVFHSIAVDAAGNQLFATCYKNITGFVIVYQILANPTGLKYVDVVVSGETAASNTGLPTQPKEIALFPLRNSLFYVDAIPHTLGPASIVKCTLNGNQCATWLNRNVNANTKLQADPNIESSRLFYTNTAGVWSRDIVSSESNIQHHFGSISNKQNYSIAPIDENSIVVSAESGKAMVIVDGKVETSIQGLENTSVIFRAASLQMQSDICRAAKCSHMCRYVRDKNSPSHDKFECLCPIGFSLSSENKRSCMPSVFCHPWQHTCADGRQCIHATKKCDGVNDCQDHSDEVSEQCHLFEPDQWPCDNGMNSVNRTLVCDGFAQCPDASDELHCRCERPFETFDCGAWSQSTSEKCIPRYLLCDRIKNCEQGEDERYMICGKLRSILPDEAQWVYYLLLAVTVFVVFLITVFCCSRSTKSMPHDMTSSSATNTRDEQISMIPPHAYVQIPVQSNHIVMNSVVYSVSNGSSSCAVLPPPNSSVSKPSSGDIPPHRFYAPPPSAASLSTYGVVNPIEGRMNTAGTARRRYRTVGPSSSEDETAGTGHQWSSTPKYYNTSRQKVIKATRSRPPSLPFTPIPAPRKDSSLSSHSSDAV